MELNNKKKFYRLYWIWNILRNGLFFHGVRNRLAKIGVDMMPYYWVLEGGEDIDPPKIRGDESGFKISYLNESELAYIQNSISGIAHKDLLKYFNEGQICIGLKHYDEIAAYMFIKRGDFTFRGRTFKLEENEAYLCNMYTFESYRGKNLAPYLRYHSYTLVKELGIEKNYSVSEYFNKSTIKFKNKLKSRPLKLFLSIILFKKRHKNYLLKSY